jgi:hypothetical protein
MSFQFNSDKETIKGITPSIIGSTQFTIRSGSGANEAEIFRALRNDSNLTRIGVNRTGRRIDKISIVNPGFGFTTEPVVQIDPPDQSDGIQAEASATIQDGILVSVVVTERGDGYTFAPNVSISGGGGSAAVVQAFIDSIDYELDINGAIRTSTSIISDTAKVLNLDVDNFATPDTKFRAPHLKNYLNGGGTQWSSVPVILNEGEYRWYGFNLYKVIEGGLTGPIPPTHSDGEAYNGEVLFKHVGFRVDDPTAEFYQELPNEGLFPRSITPALGDRSDKIATTEYVLNLATNDVGGRIYVSEQIGDDLNNGRSAAQPVRTIKRAAQLAWETPGVKETIIVSGGDYLEDNPISLPPDASVVGDNLRLVIIRPRNPRKHIFKFGDKNYVIGVTYRDKLDVNGNPEFTWDFAMVFDDKQRITYDPTVNGDFGVSFPVGHQIFGEEKYSLNFTDNTGLDSLTVNQRIRGVNSTANGLVTKVVFDVTDPLEADAFLTGSIEYDVISGSFSSGELFRFGGSDTVPYFTNTSYTLGQKVWYNQNVYTVTAAGTSNDEFPTHNGQEGTPLVDTIGTVEFTWLRIAKLFTSQDIRSIRAEGEVVFEDKDTTSFLPIAKIVGSLQGTFTDGFQSEEFGNSEDLGGIVFYTNNLIGSQNIHDFKEGQEIYIEGLPTSNPNMSALNGRQRIYKVIEDADGRSRRFVIPKKMTELAVYTDEQPYVPGSTAKIFNASHSVTLSLLNSPNKFGQATPLARRYQDACTLIRNNIDFIADEVVGRINDEFKKEYFSAYDITGTTLKIFLGESRFVHGYVSGGNVIHNGVSYPITNFNYDNSVTGEATITTSSNFAALTEDDLIKIEDITVQCVIDGVVTQKTYPSFNIPTNDNKCRRDIGHFLNGLIRDLEFGSNFNTINSAKKYIDGTSQSITYVDNEIIQTVRAIEYARELAILAMRKWRTGNGLPGNPTYVPSYSTIDQYVDDTVINDTASPACANVENAINTLSYLFVDVLANNTNGTYLDGAYLIARNRHVIAEEAYQDTKALYPSLGLDNIQERKCRRDINFILSGLIRDLCLGGNAGIVTAAESYYSGATLTGIPEAQRAETIYAFQRTKVYAQQASKNWSSAGNVIDTTPTSATYNAASGVLTVTIPDPITAVTTNDRIAFKEGALTFNCNSGSGAGNLASPQPGDANYGKSQAITNVTSTGGFTTITTNVGNAGSAAGATHVFVGALTDGTIIIHDPVITTNIIPQYENWNILLDASTPICNAVSDAIDTEFTVLENIISGSVLPGDTTKTFGTLYNTSSIITYPSSFIYDANGTRIPVRATYDDYPIIEASPYTQNSSVISFLGGSGTLVDGSKVKQPNCPFPGLQPDQSATFPNQGKSMVASAFTIVSFGGTGYKVIEDGYTQLVSVFVIFCADGVLAESGGYCSITNSATNFGTFALRGVGYRDTAYEFDVGLITEVGQTVTGKTTFEVSGLGRKPLEHYVVKIDGYRNTNETLEYFIDAVSGGASGAPATITLESGTGLPTDFTEIATGNPVSNSTMLGKTIRLHRPSIVNSSSHTWEFAGSGTDYNALPENGGVKVESREQVPQNYGRVYVSGTDELGDFKVGTFAKIENRTGAITFTGTVSISEVEFLKLKGGDVVVTGFSSDNTLGGSQSSNSLISTQKAVRDFIVNNLGPYINKPYSTNPVPRALVELTDAGTINIDQLPPIRPFSVYTVDTLEERLRLEGALAGDIAIQENSVESGGTGTTESFILNNDNDSLFLAFPVDTGLQFSVNNIYTGSVTGGKIQATEYRQGVVYTLNLTDGGSGYTSPPVVTIAGGNLQSGGVPAKAISTISGGQVVTVELYFDNGYTGGKGYTTQPSVTIDAPTNPDGSRAEAEALLESRLYGNIVNNIKITDNDSIQDSSASPQTVSLTRVINTSSSSADNWVSLSSNQIAASDITSGVISTARLANNSDAANSFTFLRGDQSYKEAVQSLKGPEERYFLKTLSPTGSGSSQIQVPYSSNIIIGHRVSGTGIAAETIIQSYIISLDGQVITITLDKPTDDSIAQGTVINFTRNPSPILLSSNQSEGNFVDSVVIANGGTGCTVDNQPTGIARNVSLSGGTGTGLNANITVTDGVVTSVVVVDGGRGYSSDFTVSEFPPELGSGSFLVLQAKKSTTNRMFANTTIDVARVTDATTDDYGTLGLARFAKSQFEIGLAGDGSVRLKTGDSSNLDADRLDGFEGSYYLNVSNMEEGTLSPSRLSGTYGIAITGQSGSSRRLYWQETAVNSPVTPEEIPEGITITPKNDGVNGLSDCPDPVNDPKPYLLVNIRASESDGGSRQLAFTDGPGDDSGGGFWFRGSNDTLTQFKNWYKVWTSGSDGAGSGLDADKLEARQGTWYQNSLNQISGYVRDGRLPKFQTAKSFLDSITVFDWSSSVHQFYINTSVESTLLGILTATPFLVGDPITVFDATGGNLGTAIVRNITQSVDGNDPQNNYVIVTATYSSGAVTQWKTLGRSIGGTTTGGIEVKVQYQDFDISAYDGNSDNIVDGGHIVAQLESDNGTAVLKMGRNTGSNSTTPAIRFFTEGSSAWQASIVASGTGETSQQTGQLEFLVDDTNSLKINANVIWNAGNVSITSSNSGSTYTGVDSADFDADNPENNIVLRNVVMRDKDGNFSAGTITADLEGTASGNLSSDGGTITGNLEIADGYGLTLAGGNLGVTGVISCTSDFKVDSDNNLFFVDVAQGKVAVGQEPGDNDGKFSIYNGALDDLVLQTSDNANTQGIAFQNSGNAYTWNIFREDAGSSTADLVIKGNPTSGPQATITDLAEYLRIEAGGNLKIAQKIGIQRDATEVLDVAGNIRVDKVIVKDDGDNPGANVELFCATSTTKTNWRLSAGPGDNLFSIQKSAFDGNGNNTGGWGSTPVLVAEGTATTTKVSINAAIPSEDYQLNVSGNINFTGTLYKNGVAFSGSNWNISGNNIYRNSTVAIGTSTIATTGNTAQTLQVNGGIAMSGALAVNGNLLWIDNNAVIRTSADTISQTLTIASGISASSTGPVTIAANTTITVEGSWSIQ